MGYVNNILKYTPSSLYGSHKFTYGEKRKLNHWFKYYFFPKYGRHMFLYEPQDNIIIEQPLLLRRVAHKVSRIEREFTLGKTTGDFGLGTQSQKLGVTGYQNPEKSGNVTVNGCKHLKSKKRKAVANVSNSQTLEREKLFDILEEKLFDSVSRIDYTLEQFVTHALSSRKRDVNIFTVDDSLHSENRNVALLSEFILSSVMREVLQDYSKVLDVKTREVDIESVEHDFQTKFRELSIAMQEDITLRRVIEDLYLYELTIRQLERKSYDLDIDKESLRTQSIKKNLDAEEDLIKVDTREEKKMEFTGDEDVAKMSKLNMKDSLFEDDSKGLDKVGEKQSQVEEFVSTATKASKEATISRNEEWLSDKFPKEVSVLDNEEMLNDKLPKEIGVSNTEKYAKKCNVSKSIDSVENELSFSKSSKQVTQEKGDTVFDFAVPDRGIKREETVDLDGKSVNRETFIQNTADFDAKSPSRKVQNNDSKVGGKVSSRGVDIEETVDMFAEARNTLEDKKFSEPKRVKKTPMAGIDINENKPIEKVDLGQVNVEELELLKIEQRKVKEEVETRLNMHKRFWFVKEYGKIDYKILPNRDFNYPPSISIFNNVEDGVYKFSYNTEFKDVTGSYDVELYDKNYKRVAQHSITSISNYDYTINNINIKIQTKDTGHGHKSVRFDIVVHEYDDIQYMIIRQPKDYKGSEVLYTVTEKLLREKHPIPFGDTLGLVEIQLHIPIMVDFINILLLMWSKFFMAFTGYTGTRAIYGLLNVVYDWLMLDTSLDQDTIEEYHRCFRWLRWEAEKVSNRAQYDPDLSGNAWIEELIYEMVDYMESHHVDKLPEFNPISKMDEYRQLFSDPSFDIPIVVDKYKGVRKRVIDKHKRLND